MQLDHAPRCRNHISGHETEQKFAEVPCFITELSPVKAKEASTSVHQLARNSRVRSLLETACVRESSLTGEAPCGYGSHAVQRSST